VAEVAAAAWAERLFRRSVLKQRKLRALVDMLGPTGGLRCLDLGSDNGVVSLMLRRRGGRWASADLTDESVASIRDLVGEDVHRLRDERLPFPDAEFDRVVVVDMLEHVADDRELVAELSRVLRPGGVLIVNTPHRRDTALRRLRAALGQTDERHGHVRPGYTAAELSALLADRFRVESVRTYSRAFSELVDTAVNLGVGLAGKRGSAKGVVVTADDVARHRRLFYAYSAVYPLMSAVAKLDALIAWRPGYMLIARARREE
jgi:SAM-dependent methyltransferase